MVEEEVEDREKMVGKGKGMERERRGDGGRKGFRKTRFKLSIWIQKSLVMYILTL